MSSASDIDNDGVVIGVAYLPAQPNGSRPVAVWWPSPTRGPQRLDRNLPGADTGSNALRINDHGQVLVSTSSHAFVVDPVVGSSREVVVPFAGARTQLFEAGMNNHGDVAGSVITRTVHDAAVNTRSVTRSSGNTPPGERSTSAPFQEPNLPSRMRSMTPGRSSKSRAGGRFPGIRRHT